MFNSSFLNINRSNPRWTFETPMKPSIWFCFFCFCLTHFRIFSDAKLVRSNGASAAFIFNFFSISLIFSTTFCSGTALFHRVSPCKYFLTLPTVWYNATSSSGCPDLTSRQTASTQKINSQSYDLWFYRTFFASAHHQNCKGFWHFFRFSLQFLRCFQCPIISFPSTFQ